MENNHAAPNDEVSVGLSVTEGLLSVDEIITELSRFTAEQCSLAWSPEPPFENTGGYDCRVGGSCGLEFNREHARARWIQARHRWNRAQRLQGTPTQGQHDAS
jgi:hypothetical protein